MLLDSLFHMILSNVVINCTVLLITYNVVIRFRAKLALRVYGSKTYKLNQPGRDWQDDW